MTQQSETERRGAAAANEAEDDPIWTRPEIFDDRDAMARNGIDLDIFDCVQLLLGDDVDLDDRDAVERAVALVLDPRNHPEFNARFVDACIRVARFNYAEWRARQ